MQFEKRAVRLGDIRPSSQNPREDFGDIGPWPAASRRPAASR